MVRPARAVGPKIRAIETPRPPCVATSMLVLKLPETQKLRQRRQPAHLTGFAKLLDSASPAILPRLTKLHNWGHYSGMRERVKVSLHAASCFGTATCDKVCGICKNGQSLSPYGHLLGLEGRKLNPFGLNSLACVKSPDLGRFSFVCREGV